MLGIANYRRVDRLMSEAGVDVMIVGTPVSVSYLTSYELWADRIFKKHMVDPGAPDQPLPLFAVYAPEKEPTLVIPAAWAPNAASSYGKVVAYGPPMFAGPMRSNRSLDGAWTSALDRATVESILPDAALTAAVNQTTELGAAPRVGIEAGPLARMARRVMRAVRPRASLVDCTNLLRLARIVKTADEISLLRQAAKIAEVAAAEGLAALADSGRVSDAVNRFHLSLVAEGAIPDHFAFGADGMGLSTDVGARLSMNHPFFVDFGCVYRRYYSDAGLTAVRGRCSGEALSDYRNVVACIQSGVDKLGPGVAASEVQEVMAAAASTTGLRGSFPHGHGVGLEVRDYPILVPSNRRRIRDGTVDVSADVSLEPGMVINLEVGYFSPKRYSMQYETTHQITEIGAVPLTDQRRDEPLVC